MGAGVGWLDWTVSGYLIGFCIGQLAWGPFSDRYGRRLPVALGLVLFLIGCAGCAMSDSVTMLIGWRVLQAIGASASVVIARVIVRDMYHGIHAAKLMSTLMTVMAIAPLLGPSVGSLILRVASWRAIFWTLTVVGMIALAVLWTVPETLPRDARTRVPLSHALRTYGQLLRHRAMLGYGGVAGCYFGASFAYVTGSPFLYITYFHFSPQWYGAMFAAGIVGIMLANQVNARLLGRYSVTTLIRAGASIAALAAITSTVAAPLGWGGRAGTVVPLLIVVAANGFISANAIAGALSCFAEGGGAVSALLGCVQYGTGMVGSALVGVFAGATPRSLEAVIASMCIGSALCAWLLLPSRASAVGTRQ
jgi:DHA1 family bicyclomycin/chloramphenicol resistance-like MFS transporter